MTFPLGALSMPSGRKVPADRLVLALVSVLRTLIHELHKERAIEIGSLLSALDSSIAAHRERGDPNELADAIEMITQHVRDSVSRPPKTKRDRH
jgi:hypothetical protein